mgnify:CR=1 FL=1
MNFTDSDGLLVSVPESQVEVVENNPNYTVYQARKNPGGEVLMNVRYNDGDSNMGDYAANTEETYDDSQLNDSEDQERIHSNPAKLFTWRNLKLQRAISGSKAAKGKLSTVAGMASGGVAKVYRLMTGLRKIPANQSIRDNDNLLMLTTAEDWYTYVNKMRKSPIDLGAEFSTQVSKAQQGAVFLFVHEWENDPQQHSFRRRLVAGADVSDAVAKGQIVYDIMTGRGPEPIGATGYGTFVQDKAFRLALDIIRSLPLNLYNYYTINSIHADEGDAVFADLRKRYIALEMTEVEMVLEMQAKLAELGDSYAFNTTKDTAHALDAAELMKTAVAAYQVGDTRTVRTALMTLADAPFGYEAKSGRVTKIHGGKEKAATDDHVQIITSITVDPKKLPSSVKEHVSGTQDAAIMYATGVSSNKAYSADTKKLKSDNKDGPKQFVVVKGPYDIGPVGWATKVKEGNKFKYQINEYEGQILGAAKHTDKPGVHRAAKSLGAAMNPIGADGLHFEFTEQERRRMQKKADEAAEDKFGNPSGKGRGNFYHIEIHHKNALKMKRRGPTSEMRRGTGVTGEMRHGISKNTGKWTKGLNKLFPGMDMVRVGTLKKTGEEAPYRIKLPKDYFKIKVQHGIKTLVPKKDIKRVLPAYQKLIDFYGIPEKKPNKDTHDRFVIPASQRNGSPYYDKVRTKIGKKKKSAR